MPSTDALNTGTGRVPSSEIRGALPPSWQSSATVDLPIVEAGFFQLAVGMTGSPAWCDRCGQKPSLVKIGALSRGPLTDQDDVGLGDVLIGAFLSHLEISAIGFEPASLAPRAPAGSRCPVPAGGLW